MADDERSEGFAWASDWFLCQTALLDPPTLILQQLLFLSSTSILPLSMKTHNCSVQ
jgi:hypothetical protein